FPVSAVLSTDEIVQAAPFSLPSASSSSYGGNPLAAAAALATIRTVLDEELVENSARVGGLMLDGLRAVARRHTSIANVRGKGLLVGFDLVEASADAQSTEHGPNEGGQAMRLMRKDRCVAFFKECLANGLILMAYTPRVRIHPPLVLSAEEASRAVAIIDGALSSFESRVR